MTRVVRRTSIYFKEQPFCCSVLLITEMHNEIEWSLISSPHHLTCSHWPSPGHCALIWDELLDHFLVLAVLLAVLFFKLKTERARKTEGRKKEPSCQTRLFWPASHLLQWATRSPTNWSTKVKTFPCCRQLIYCLQIWRLQLTYVSTINGPLLHKFLWSPVKDMYAFTISCGRDLPYFKEHGGDTRYCKPLKRSLMSPAWAWEGWKLLIYSFTKRANILTAAQQTPLLAYQALPYQLCLVITHFP